METGRIWHNSTVKDKVILTDCDGVLLDWQHGFDEFMKQMNHRVVNNVSYKMYERYDVDQRAAKEYIKFFNMSACMRFLPPLRDAIRYIKRLHKEHGYVFHVITSQTDNIFAQKLREQNLKSIFGESCFEKIIILDCGADKDDALEEYKDSDCFWIEDKVENAQVGIAKGLDSILMAHSYNADYEGNFPRLQNWKAVYDHIVS